ncbi:MAG: cation-translocating P-type ATPase, partial [Planctomycetota bacterium]
MNDPFAQSPDRVVDHLEVDPSRGLAEDDATRRLEQHGPNRLHQQSRRPWWFILLEQFKSAMIILLTVAAVVAAVYGQWPEAIAIGAVMVVNALIGFFSEWKARRSMEALHDVDKTPVTVLRDGEQKQLQPDRLVPGDIVVLEAEAFVPADIRLLEAEGARVNEAALTGEAVPVNKTVDAVDDQVPLAERTSMAYMGTTLVEGSLRGVVVHTGMDTELGHIAEMAGSAESAAPPLQKRLDKLARKMAVVVVVVAAAVAGGGLWAGRETRLMIETALALGVAAIPEGLPIVTTIALARGMWLMAGRNALVKRIAAVETLGATRVIFTDKTGTLTENRMTLRRVVTDAADYRLTIDQEEVKQRSRQDEGDGDDERAVQLMNRVVRIGVLCNDAELNTEDDQTRGDPTEVALLQAGVALDMPRGDLVETMPERRQVDFDPDTMMMATVHEDDDGLRVAVKGAPERVLEACTALAGADGDEASMDDQLRQQWTDRTNQLALDGLRVMAFAEKRVDREDAEPYEGLTFVGLMGLEDPPREDVREAIDTCQAAG